MPSRTHGARICHWLYCPPSGDRGFGPFPGPKFDNSTKEEPVSWRYRLVVGRRPRILPSQPPSAVRRLLPSPERMNTAGFLRLSPAFKSLADTAELAHFGQLVREKSYPKGSVILFEDDPGDALFVVRAGRVKVVLVAERWTRSDSRNTQRGRTLRRSPSLIDDQPRSHM